MNPGRPRFPRIGGRALPAVAMAVALPMTAQSPQEDEILREFLELIQTPVVSASQVLQSRIKAPAKVVAITWREIDQRGYLTLEDVLRDLAGFDFNRSFGVEWSTIFMRGFRSSNSDRFLVIWDGVVQNDLWKQSAWVSRQYPLGRVQRIEVMYGPASLLYGANAMSGIINVILKEGSRQGGSEARILTGPDQTRAAEFCLSGGRGALTWEFTGRYFESDEADFNGKSWTDQGGRVRPYSLQFPQDFASPSDANYALVLQGGLPTYLHDGRRVPMDGRYTNPSRVWFSQIKAKFRGWSLAAVAWVNEEGQGQWYTALNKLQSPWTPYGGSLHFAHESEWRPGITGRTYLQFRYAGIDEDDSYGLRFKANFTQNLSAPQELKLYRLDPTLFSKIFNRELKVGHRVSLSRSSVQTALGAEYTASDVAEDYSIRTSSASPWSTSPRHQPRNLALYGNAQIPLSPRWDLSVGSRYDYNYHRGEPGGFGSLLTSRVALLFAPAPAHQFKLIWGQGFQEPPPFQKWSTAPSIRDLPAPDLRPEKLRSTEFAYILAPSQSWQLSLNVYRTDVSGFITLRKGVSFGGGTTSQYQNLGGVVLRGAELEWTWRTPQGLACFLNATAAQAEDASTGRKTGDIAGLKGNAGLEFRWTYGWDASLRAHAVGPRDTVNWDSASPYVVRRIPSHVTFDASVRWRGLTPGLSLQLSAFNLLNRIYYEPGVRTADGITYNAALLQPPFQAFLGLHYLF